jgi:hypothetical protein
MGVSAFNPSNPYGYSPTQRRGYSTPMGYPGGGGGGFGFGGFGGFGGAPAPPPMGGAPPGVGGGGAGWDWKPLPSGPQPPQPVGGGSGGLPAPPDLHNIAQDNPDLRYLIDQYKQRLSAAPEQRAIEQAGSAIRDTTSGLMKELGGDLASRGLAGSGVENEERLKLAQGAQQGIGRAAGSIATQRQQDLDRLVMGGEGLMKAPSQNALQQQELGLQQYGLQQQGQIAQMQAQMEQQRLAMQQQQMAANLWGNYMNAFF